MKASAKDPNNQPTDREFTVTNALAVIPFETDLDDPSDLEGLEIADECWDAFIADDDELDPFPEDGDFWCEPDDD